MGEQRASADEVMDEALRVDIRQMLAELGDPPLVTRIFPNGWEKAPHDGLVNLHRLCLRTFASRSTQPPAQPPEHP